jgi:hypothetical protein
MLFEEEDDDDDDDDGGALAAVDMDTKATSNTKQEATELKPRLAIMIGNVESRGCCVLLPYLTNVLGMSQDNGEESRR